MKHRTLIVQGGVAGLVIALAAAGAWSTFPYTSTAVLRANAPKIPERFVAAQQGFDVQRMMPALGQMITSRGNLTNIVHMYDLYPRLRARLPMEEVVERMRGDVRIATGDMGTIRVSFSYPEDVVAQKVTADLVARMITEYSRERTQQAVMTFQFMRDQAQKAALEWEESLAAASGKSPARARLDADIARQRYEMLSAKMAEADMSAAMERRMQGHTLELLDPASLPFDSRPSLLASAIVGPIAGALLGWLISVVLSIRAARTVAEAH